MNFVPPYLRRNEFRTFNGELVEVWSLLDQGYLVAELVTGRVVEVPKSEVGADFLEHSVTLSDLFVALLDPAAGECPTCGRKELGWFSAAQLVRDRKVDASALRRVDKENFVLACASKSEGSCTFYKEATPPRAENLPFRWVTSDAARLPWTEYDRRSGKALDRLILPDAIVEVAGQRLFLECEMGTHSIVGGDGKHGATIAKAQRYWKFLTAKAGHGHDSKTFYASQFGDDLAPVVLFLVRTEGRRENIQRALERWQAAAGVKDTGIRAITFEAARRFILGKTTTACTSTSSALSHDDLDRLRRFYASVIVPIKEARATARADRKPLPAYPECAEEVGNLLTRLSGSVRKPPSRSAS
jgi:hypothetical protein